MLVLVWVLRRRYSKNGLNDGESRLLCSQYTGVGLLGGCFGLLTAAKER